MTASGIGIEFGYLLLDTLYYRYFSNYSKFIHISLGTHNGLS